LKLPLQSLAERAFLGVTQNPVLSRITGRFADAVLPTQFLRRAMKSYIKAYDVDMSEVEAELNSFKTFNAFFTRKLVDGARPVDPGETTVVSPADARLQTAERIPSHGRLEQVKGSRYSLAALLGDEAQAATYREGWHATLYLSPRDYHRVHIPIDGKILSWRHIPGRLYPVNNLAVRHIEGLFTVNERVVVFLESETFGPMALAMVGAANVGKITLSFTDSPGEWRGDRVTDVTPPEPISVQRGDELGMFNLGSTVVLVSADPDLEVASVLEGEHIKMGAPLWRRS
jgi:phosphatidylserine decarboxylase